MSITAVGGSEQYQRPTKANYKNDTTSYDSYHTNDKLLVHQRNELLRTVAQPSLKQQESHSSKIAGSQQYRRPSRANNKNDATSYASYHTNNKLLVHQRNELLRTVTDPPVKQQESLSSKMNTKVCLARYSKLLSRVDVELKPWKEKGISRSMIDRMWLCDGSGLPDGAKDPRPAFGLFGSFRKGKFGVEVAGIRLERQKGIILLLQKAAQVFDIPDVDFVLPTGDHLEQSFGRPYDGTFNQSLAPLLVAYRKQLDSGTIAVPGKKTAHAGVDMCPLSMNMMTSIFCISLFPQLLFLTDWSFSKFTTFPAGMPTIDDAAGLIRNASLLYPWGSRKSLVYFNGKSHKYGGVTDERRAAWYLLQKEPGWGKIGLIGTRDFANANKDRPDLHFNITSLPSHCQYKYLLNLAGNAASARYKYLFFCNSTVISPVRSGGFGGASEGNEYEEFFYHRLKDGENVLKPPTVHELPQVVAALNDDGTRARRIAAAGLKWANREITMNAALCYWAYALAEMVVLERKGGALAAEGENKPALGLTYGHVKPEGKTRPCR
jgi:hypothetical protein